MLAPLRKSVSIILLILFAGCAPPISEPTNTASDDIPVLVTETPLQLTQTSPLPTKTATPLPTKTAVPIPTDAPTPEPTIPAFNVTDEIAYIPDGDPAQKLSIYLPQEENRKPLTLLVQGGEGFPVLVQNFAELGYPVITFNVRDDSYAAEIQDGFCALAWAHANASTYGFDEDGIIPVGGSMWGGNAALMGLVKDASPFLEGCPEMLPEIRRVRAVITLAGVFDYSEEEDFFYGFIDAISDFMGGPPDQVPENWAAASAITWVQGDEPPFLLVHGEVDTNVAPHQSEKFAEALEAAGTDVELVLLPGVNHSSSVTNPSVFEAMQSFLERLE
jgi:acetyl esterase/lipase